MSKSLVTDARGGLMAAFVLTACGGSDDGATVQGTGTGTVTEAWADFCTLTFTAETEIADVFGDPTFTAQAGDEYLLSEHNDAFGERQTEILFLTEAGPEALELSPEQTGFTTSCALNAGVPYYGAFTDVSVYAEAELTTKLCDLAEGTALPAAGGQRGYSIVGGITLSGPQTYEIYLDAFSERCGGRQVGYVSVPETHLFGSDTWLVPIVGLLGPS